jgi:hypothetical protein
MQGSNEFLRIFGYKRGDTPGLTTMKRPQKPFFDCGGQSCRIIPDNTVVKRGCALRKLLTITLD